MNKSVTDILEEVCSDICDNYCKYRDTVDEGGKCEAIRTGLRCPLDRLNLSLGDRSMKPEDLELFLIMLGMLFLAIMIMPM